MLFAANERYLVNEKGALAESETFTCAIPGVVRQASEIWAAIGAGDLAGACRRLRVLEGALESASAQSEKPI